VRRGGVQQEFEQAHAPQLFVQLRQSSARYPDHRSQRASFSYGFR
jgi:hypothetical protein